MAFNPFRNISRAINISLSSNILKKIKTSFFALKVNLEKIHKKEHLEKSYKNLIKKRRFIFHNFKINRL